jgi:hypothetical protein
MLFHVLLSAVSMAMDGLVGAEHFAEGHRGHDGKYYLVDFARLFPPEWTAQPFVFLYFIRSYSCV